jgi:hypothetical protein
MRVRAHDHRAGRGLRRSSNASSKARYEYRRRRAAPTQGRHSQGSWQAAQNMTNTRPARTCREALQPIHPSARQHGPHALPLP